MYSPESSKLKQTGFIINKALDKKIKWYSFPKYFLRLKLVEYIDDFERKTIAKNDRGTILN